MDLDLYKPDTIYITRHDSAIEPNGEQTSEGIAMPHFEYLKWLSDRYDLGEKVYDMIIVHYQTTKAVWDHTMKSGDFSFLSDDFFDSLAAIEVLIQRERVVEKYVSIFGEEPKPILSLEDYR